MDHLLDRAERRDSSATTVPVTATPSIAPASDYLAERLEKRRASNARPRRARYTDIGPRINTGVDDDIFLTEADEEAYNRRSRLSDRNSALPGARAALAASHGRSKSPPRDRRRTSMGVRSMDEKMDKLTKENFALKLEVDQRRRQTVKMQEQVDAMTARVDRFDKLQEEHAELWRINDTLVKELEKRDKAVEEAIDTICDLEDRMAELQERNSNSSFTRPSTAHADSGYAGTETHEHAPQPSPQKVARPPRTPQPDQQRPGVAAASAAGNKLQNVTHARTPGAGLKREPNVLSLRKQSTNALRSVYLDNSQSLNGVKSFISLLKERESTADGNEDDILNSPRLSVLSESSFPSIYSPKKTDMSPDRFAWEGEADDATQRPHIHLRQDSIKRVSQWINDGQQIAPSSTRLPRKVSSSSEETERDVMLSSPSKRPGDEARFRSIADTLSDATTVRPSYENFPSLENKEQPKMRKAKPLAQRPPRPSSFAGPIFGEQLLPPTPDSVSTRMLRGSRSTMAEDRSQFDAMPIGAATSIATVHEPGLRTAPKQMRSSVELNNAYSSYVQHSTSPVQQDHGVAVENGYFSGLENGNDADDDARSETVRDLSLEYDGFPDGNSILMGTPSRFLKHGKPLPRPAAQAVASSPAPAPPVFFDDHHDPSPARYSTRPPVGPSARRRQSSSEVPQQRIAFAKHVAQRKPSLSRTQTSPSSVSAAKPLLTIRPSSSRRPGSSSASGNSNGRGGGATSPISTSSSLSQRTQKLFRRLSLGNKG